MRELILAALKTRFEGVDAKILGRIADKLAKTTTKEEDVATAVEGVTLQTLLESYGDSRATDATKTAVLNYEKKYGLKDGVKAKKNVEEDDDDDSGDDDDDDNSKATKKEPKAKTGKQPQNPELKAALDAIATLTAKIEGMEKGKVVETRKQKLAKVLEGLTDTQKKPYQRLNLSDYESDEDFDNFVSEVEAEAKELIAENAANGASFSAPFGGEHRPSGSKKDATDTEIDDVIANMKI